MGNLGVGERGSRGRDMKRVVGREMEGSLRVAGRGESGGSSRERKGGG
jgi:hypothetical protein